MRIPRVIPVLLLKNGGLVKTQKFRDPVYVGDPLNAVKIFNEKEVDELIFLDITASPENKKPPLDFLREVASECFMPLCYGGGVRSANDVKEIIRSGVEKVSLNTAAVLNINLVKEISELYGSSTVVVSMDVKKNFFGKYEVWVAGGRKNTGKDPVKLAEELAKAGAGEILLNNIDRDGLMKGYDLNLIQKVSSVIDIPLIACGGAGSLNNFREAVDQGASAASAGSMFVFQGIHRAVLINYPEQKKLKEIFA